MADTVLSTEETKERVRAATRLRRATRLYVAALADAKHVLGRSEAEELARSIRWHYRHGELTKG